MQISRIWTVGMPYFCTAVIVWIAFAAGNQVGWGPFLGFLLKAALAFVVVVALLGNAWAVPQLFVPVIGYLIWWQIASPLCFWRDTFLLYMVIVRFDWKHTEGKPQKELARGLGIAFVAWIVLSGVDLLWSQSGAPPEPNHYRALRES